MAIICWGNLAKSADDTTRVEQSIQHYVGTHDENPNAHMGEDYALGVHRLQTVLDHSDGSVTTKHLIRNSLVAISSFESFDGWGLTGNGSPGVMNARIYTTAVTNNVSILRQEPSDSSLYFIPAKDPYLSITVDFSHITDQVVYLLLGAIPDEGAGDGCGFKVVDGTLYAVWISSGAEHTQEISGITLTNPNSFAVEMDSSEGEVKFYVNNVLKHTSTANYPVDICSFLYYFYIKTTSANVRTLTLINFCYQRVL